MPNLTLNLNDLAVESFPTVGGDPSQWLMREPPETDDSGLVCCSMIAGPPPTEGCDTNLYAAPAETHERICTSV
ncbi:MAG TPA: hypothetical protein VGX50_17865 [Longimicrobium sp.]|jgi:hypothetical protein|nr:hypothetical protein [Longimicrobium sp.]